MKSRVNFNAKQQKLKNKLQAIRSQDELVKIYNNVEQQNNTLRQDVFALKYKVDLLMGKQKNQKSFVTKEEENKNKQLRMFQIELKEQFKIMSELKKRKEQSNYQKGTEQISERALEVANKIKIIDIELATTKKEILDFKKQGQRLQLTLANHQQEQKRNQPKINEYSSQNGELKKKILSLRKISMEKQHQSVKIMNSMYTVKTKYKKNEEFQQEIQNLKLNSTNQKVTKSKNQNIDVEVLQREVEQLRKEVQKRQKQFNKSEIIALKRKEELLQQNKQLVANQKELQDKKLKAGRELNKYKNIWAKYIQIKNNSKNLKEYIPNALQIDTYVQTGQPLRRDYAGIMGGRFSFDDRQALQNNKTSYMAGFMVYELDQTAKNHLVALKIIYDDAQANQRINIPIPGQVLNKCKLSKYMLMEGDFIKLFKVKYQSVDSRILKVEIRTNKNSRYEFGDKRQFNDLSAGENVYGFDISVLEYPVCLFGSYNSIRSQWYLQSLGVQINELSMNSSMVDKQEKKNA